MLERRVRGRDLEERLSALAGYLWGHPDDVAAWRAYTTLVIEAGPTDQTLSEIREASERLPRSRVWVGLVTLLLREGSRQSLLEARDLSIRATHERPFDPEPFALLVNVCTELDDVVATHDAARDGASLLRPGVLRTRFCDLTIVRASVTFSDLHTVAIPLLADMCHVASSTNLPGDAAWLAFLLAAILEVPEPTRASFYADRAKRFYGWSDEEFLRHAAGWRTFVDESSDRYRRECSERDRG